MLSLEIKSIADSVILATMLMVRWVIFIDAAVPQVQEEYLPKFRHPH